MIDFIKKTNIEKGWSGDQKYHVMDECGKDYLLRISAPETYDAKLGEFNMMKRIAELGIPMCINCLSAKGIDGVMKPVGAFRFLLINLW